MHQTFRIGCSGYYYSYWKNRFYPRGIQPKNWLEYYSSVFNTVEMNGTFYRQPKLADLKRQYQNTPTDFKFSVKMSRYITHIDRLREKSTTLIPEFQDLILQGLEDKLLHFLFQMPPSFQYSEQNLEAILTKIPHTPANVIELRHLSWWNEQVQHAFAKSGLTFCNVDFPGMNTYFIQTGPLFYLRLHGNPELFKSSYSDEELKKFYLAFPKACEQYSIYFNNTYYEAGYRNALSLKEMIASAR
jgi:uncharacterized protein YecE (DUF72 family)